MFLIFHRKMNDAEKLIEYETKSISEAIDYNVKNIVKTESTNEITILSEHEWLCPDDSGQAEQMMEPNKGYKIKNIVTTESTNEINIRSEHEWLCPDDSEQAGQMVEPNSSIVKSEYEIQSIFFNWSVDETANSDDEYKEDAEDNNSDDCNIDHDNINDWGYDGGDQISEPINSTDTEKRLNKQKSLDGIRKEQYSFCKKKQNLLQQYLLRDCPCCGIEFKSAKSWDTHLKDMHFTYSDADNVSCNECRTVLSNKDFILKTHILMHFPYKNIFKCKLCFYACSKHSVLLFHIERNHFDVVCDALSTLIVINQDALQKCCAYCGKYVGISSMLSTHIQVEHREIYEHKLFYVCPFCGEQFVQEKLHKEHLKNIHKFESLEGLSLEVIGKQKNNVSNMKYRCLKCSELFAYGAYSSGLIVHAMRHLPYRCFKCRYCEYENMSRSKVIQHTCKDLLIDIKKNPMQKTMATPQLIRRRRRNFDVINKLHVCPKCGENFEQQALWEAHLIKEHHFDKYEYLNIKTTASSDGESRITSCTICKKILAKPTDFFIKQHAFTHMPYKIYKCRQCQASMTSLFVCHCKGSPTTIYVCPKCGKEFKIPSHWNNHMIYKHNLRKPSGLNFKKISDTEALNYKCSDCGAVVQESSPSRTDLLFKHAAIAHMSFKCYKCNNCGKQSNCKDSIVEHCSNCLNQSKLNTTAENEVASDAKTIINRKRMLSTEDTVENTAKPLCKTLKRSDINNSMTEHSNNINKTELNTTAENEVTSKTTIKTNISSKIILSIGDVVKNKMDTKETKKPRRKFVKNITQSDSLEINTNNLKKLPQTSMATCTQKSVVFNKYSKYVTYACPECNIPLATSEAWHTHISVEHEFFAENGLNITPIPGVGCKGICNECSVGVSGCRMFWERHKLTHMPYQAFVCMLCMLRFTAQTDVINHIQRKHFTVGEFKCVICDLVFKTSYERYKHTKEEHADAKWPKNVCHICMKVLYNRWTLANHLKVHELNREIFECGFCDRKHYYAYKRRRHWMECHPVEYESFNRREKKLVVQEDIPKNNFNSKPMTMQTPI